jgi:arsenite methyltransferase
VAEAESATQGALDGAIVFPSAAVAACCAAVYGHPFAALIVGESFHPGGLTGTRDLLKAGAPARGASLLDIGCGLGASSRIAYDEFGLDVTAVDVSSSVLRQAEERGGDRNIEWQRADAEHLPFEDAAFDHVLAECVLSAIPGSRALTEIRRVLRPGGSLLLSDVRRSGEPVSALEEHPLLGTALCVSTAWTPGEFERMASAASFGAVRTWGRDEAIANLLDRIEGRLTIARDLLSGTASPSGAADAFSGVDSASIKRLIGSVRASVEAGDIGYFAAVASPNGAVAGGPR